MSPRFVPGVVAAALLLGAAVSPVSATCGSATCFLVTETNEGVGTTGTLRVDLSFRYVDQTRMLSGTSDVGEVLTPKIDFENKTIEPDHHREISTLNTLVQLDLAYGASTRTTVLATLPLFNQKNHEHYDDVGTPNEHFTRSDGTSGFGDAQIGLRYALIVKSKDLLFAGLVAKLPTGAYKLRDSEGAINEPTIQPGSGSYDFIGSVSYARHPFPSPLEWFASGSYRLNRENALDYRIGDESIVSAGVSYGGRGKLQVSLQVNARRGARDEYRGQRVPSTGAELVALSPGIHYMTATGVTFYVHLQLPVYEKVNEAQLAPRTGFVLGVSRTF